MCLFPHAASTDPSSLPPSTDPSSLPPTTVGNGVVSGYSLLEITAVIIVVMVAGALVVNT